MSQPPNNIPTNRTQASTSYKNAKLNLIQILNTPLNKIPSINPRPLQIPNNRNPSKPSNKMSTRLPSKSYNKPSYLNMGKFLSS